MAAIRNDRPLTHERLIEALQYDPITGLFLWRITASPKAVAGSVAGTINKRGYRIIRIDGELYKASRLAWFYTFGEWPESFLDHANRIKTDDRIDNLRQISCCENAWNVGVTSRNTSGYKGVSFAKSMDKWQASISNEGRAVHLGYFADPLAAHNAYRDAAIKARGEIGVVV